MGTLPDLIRFLDLEAPHALLGYHAGPASHSRRPHWKTNSLEDDLTGSRPQ